MLAGFPIAGISSMLLSQFVRRKEWVNRLEDECCQSTVKENWHAVEKENRHAVEKEMNHIFE